MASRNWCATHTKTSTVEPADEEIPMTPEELPPA